LERLRATAANGTRRIPRNGNIKAAYANLEPVETRTAPCSALKVVLETPTVKTRGPLKLISITRHLNDVLQEHGLRVGMRLVQSLQTTTANFNTRWWRI
jgi:hypothetical protein